MYSFLKSIIKNVLPSKLLRQLKPIFRNGVYWFYKGNQFHCLLCNANLKSFVILPNKDLLCPRCGSLPRTRRLIQLLTEKNLLHGSILHCSPPLSIYKNLKANSSIQYISSDFENEFIADKKYDLTNITADDHTVDLVIAYHVLEHIEEDHQAMKELYRILKKEGKVIIQTPFKEGEIFEDFTIQSEQDRLKHFGQKDHVRIYAVDGLTERLTKVGFKVEVLQFSEVEGNANGFKTQETVLLARK